MVGTLTIAGGSWDLYLILSCRAQSDRFGFARARRILPLRDTISLPALRESCGVSVFADGATVAWRIGAER